jgi:hypothetical protein
VLVAVSTSRLSCKRVGKNANIDAGLGFIWRISDYKSGGVVAVWDVVFQIYNNTIWIPPVGTDPNHAQACYIFGFSGTFPVGVLIATISVTLAARTNGHGLVCRLRRTGAA